MILSAYNMISPTGSDKIRVDGWGDGNYGAPRTKGNISYEHTGIDYECSEGWAIVSPTDAKFIRIAYPYADTREYSGGLFRNEWCEFKIFYFSASIDKKSKVKKGEILGYAQSISNRYPCNNKNGKMFDHVHFEISKIFKINPMFFIQ
jgi:hypothetical protein